MKTKNFTSEMKGDIVRVYEGNPYHKDLGIAHEARLVLEIHKVHLNELMTELHKNLKK